MAKYYGMIGFAETVETEPGYHEEVIKELPYFGDVLSNFRNLQPTTVGTNDDINISNRISIVADPYANNHFYAMRYATFAGSKWKVKDVDASQYPRLILSLGGLYNG